MLHISAKSAIILLLAAGITVAAIAREKDKKTDDRRATNLKVLPKNLAHDSLITLMKMYSVSLGVKCGFCHAPSATEKGKLDFASDDKKHKEIARDMMRMTARINRKYFGSGEESGKHTTVAVSCYTCHRGHAEPEAFVMPPAEEKH